tara:strand:- start:11290 stop:11523 length:234 start_codon:yes stop_codon:yes gene_type:complete
MDANRTWTVIVETPSGMEQVVVVRYPRRPTNDLAAGLVRHILGMAEVPEEYRFSEEASIRALESAGYRLLEVTQSSE